MKIVRVLAVVVLVLSGALALALWSGLVGIKVNLPPAHVQPISWSEALPSMLLVTVPLIVAGAVVAIAVVDWLARALGRGQRR